MHDMQRDAAAAKRPSSGIVLDRHARERIPVNHLPVARDRWRGLHEAAAFRDVARSESALADSDLAPGR